MRFWTLVSFMALALSACSSPPSISATGTWKDLTAKIRPTSRLDCPNDPMYTFELIFTLNQSGQNIQGTVRESQIGMGNSYGDISAQLRSDGTVAGNLVFYSRSGTPIPFAFEGRFYTTSFTGRTIGPMTSTCPANGQMVNAYMEWDAQKQ